MTPFFPDNRYYEKIGKNEPVDITDDLPFEIPETWTWIRFNETFEIRNGFTPLKSNKEFWTNGTIPWFTIEDKHIQGEIISDTIKKINQICVTNERIVPANSVLLCCTASIGEVVFTKIPLTSNQQFNGISVKKDYNGIIFPLFVFEFCKTLKEKLISMATSTTFGFVSVKKISSLFMPLPPLEEQERIVKRIEELMPLVDEYARLETKDKELDDKLPGMLKQSILQYAMEGKLVKQNPDDEPASVLLERIKIEKERLIKEGKIKRDKNETLIIQDDDKNYYENLPVRYVITSLSDAGIWRSGSTPLRSNKDYYNGNILWIKTGELNNAYVYNSVEKITDLALKECSLPIQNIGNILIAMYGATIGKLAIVGTPLTTNQACCGCQPFNGIHNEFLFYYLMANKKKFIDSGEGGAQPNISREKIVSYPFILMPTNEQIKIANKIKNLFAIIN